MKKNRDKGHSIFNTLPKKRFGGKKVFHRKLVILDLEDTVSSNASPYNVFAKPNTRRSVNMKENRFSTGEVQVIFISESQA